MSSADRDRVFLDIDAERDRQELKFGVVNLPNGTGNRGYIIQARNSRAECQTAAFRGDVSWALVLREEVYEALEIVEIEPEDTDKLRAELVQVAAVAANWIECIDRNKRSGAV